MNSAWLVLGGADRGNLLRFWAQVEISRGSSICVHHRSIRESAQFCRRPQGRERPCGPDGALSAGVPCRRSGAKYRFPGQRRWRRDFRGFRFRGGPQRETFRRSAARHQFTWIDGDFAAIADDDHATIRMASIFRSVARFTLASISRIDIDALPTGGFQNFFGVARFGVIERLMRTFRFTRSRPLGVPAVPKTVMPIARANCTAAVPTPPLAPWIRSVSPARACAWCCSAV